MANENTPQINLDDDIETLNLTLNQLQRGLAVAVREIRGLKERVYRLETLLATATTQRPN